jgi:hypothetical protein
MAIKIRITDLDRARDCIQWLMSNIGELESNQGIVMRGIGWTANLVVDADMAVNVELSEHVDEQDVTMFMLRWAQ